MNYRVEQYYKSSYGPITDQCINCNSKKPVSDIITETFPDRKEIVGPICEDCHPKKILIFA